MMEFAAEVALPVVGVLVCALLVFAFGFKSPGQPPSFDFDDKKKLRRAKQKTGRSHTGNGHVPASTEEAPSKPSAGGKSLRPAAVSAGANKPGSPTSSKANTAVKQDKKPAVKKPKTGKTEEKLASTEPEPAVDDDGWMTQVSKKGKKQRSKKDEADVSDKRPLREESVEAPVVETEPDVPAPQPDSPPLEKRKKKSRKTSKGSPEEMGSGSGEPAIPTPAPAEPVIVVEAPTIEAEPEVDREMEILPEEPAEAMEEEEVAAPKPSKAGKGKKLVVEEDDFEIPDVYTKPAISEPEPPPVSKPAKSPRKSKKERRQEAQLSKLEAVRGGATSEPTKESRSSPGTEERQLSEAMVDLPAQDQTSVAAPATTGTEPEPTLSAQPTDNVTFDELGDSWIEAKVKTKKKKARREN